METSFRKNIYESMEPVWSGTGVRETTEEQVVPDALPDIGAVLETDGVLTVRGKETETGCVRVSASLAAAVVYAPEDGGAPRCVEVTLPADIRLEAEGADEDCAAAVSVRVRSIEARALNSRKLSVRAEVEASACVYRRASLEIAAGLETEDGGAHILTETAEAFCVSNVREKTFALTDEYALPSDARTLLSRRVEAVAEDVQYVGGKAVFRGRVRSSLLFGAEDGRLCAGRYETEFSQIMEAGAGDAESLPRVTLLLTGAYFDMPEDGGKLAAEIHLAAQCVCRERRAIPYIADIYSNQTELTPQFESVRMVTEARPVSMRQTVTGQAEPFDGGELVRTTASVGSVTVEGDTVRTTVNVRLIYRRGDGSCAAARCRLPAEFTLSDMPAGAALSDISVTVMDAYASAGGGGADVRVVLQMDALMTAEREIACVCAAASDDEAWQRRARTPSVVLVRVPAGTRMWDIARRWGSTVEAIAAANEGRQEGLLLIPKGR